MASHHTQRRLSCTPCLYFDRSRNLTPGINLHILNFSYIQLCSIFNIRPPKFQDSIILKLADTVRCPVSFHFQSIQSAFKPFYFILNHFGLLALHTLHGLCLKTDFKCRIKYLFFHIMQYKAHLNPIIRLPTLKMKNAMLNMKTALFNQMF